MTAAVVVDSAGMDGRVGVGSMQAFFKGVGLTAMDLDKHLCCLSQNSALRMEVISSFSSSSSSSSSSQIIGGTSRLTPVSSSSLKNEEDGDDKTDEEDEDVGGGVLTL